jgi:hypothetical protein
VAYLDISSLKVDKDASQQMLKYINSPTRPAKLVTIALSTLKIHCSSGT